MPPPRSTRVVLLPVAALLLLLRLIGLRSATGNARAPDRQPSPARTGSRCRTRTSPSCRRAWGRPRTRPEQFTLDGIPAGTYAVTIEQISAETKTIPDVVIKGGELTKLGAITLKAKALELKKVTVTGAREEIRWAGIARASYKLIDSGETSKMRAINTHRGSDRHAGRRRAAR